MDNMSIEGTVGAALALQQVATGQEQQNLLLRKVLDGQADAVSTLLNSLPQLATTGAVGTQVHVTA
jgi:hypothetical protein